uniref:Uncharacterized protein n=1 Tax=Cyprinus carpio carpio TaxID=630221 RepID=A0A8C1HWP2_CYPCA
MSHQIDDVMALCCKISESRQIKAAVRNSAKGAAVAGGGAFVGGLLGGPPGLFIGGALGGAAGWWMTSDTFLPLHQIIMEMPPQQKKKLYSDVMAVLGKLDWVDLAQLMFLVMVSVVNNIPQNIFCFVLWKKKRHTESTDGRIPVLGLYVAIWGVILILRALEPLGGHLVPLLTGLLITGRLKLRPGKFSPVWRRCLASRPGSLSMLYILYSRTSCSGASDWQR